jgi:hypothetical protein
MGRKSLSLWSNGLRFSMHQVPIRRSMVLRTVTPCSRRTEISGRCDRNRVASHRYDIEATQKSLNLSSRPLAGDALQHLAQHQIPDDDFLIAEDRAQPLDVRHVATVEEVDPDCCRRRSPGSSALSATCKVALPTVFAKGRANILLPLQLDHQAQRLFYRLLLGGVSRGSLGFRHQLIIDFDIGAHRRSSCNVYGCILQYTYSSCNDRLCINGAGFVGGQVTISTRPSFNP